MIATDILNLIRDGKASTRSELMEQTGLSRTTIGARLSELKARGLITESGNAASTGGRPSGLLAFHAAAGLVLAIDVGATGATVAISDLAGESLAERHERRNIDADPEDTLAWATDELRAMLNALGRSPDDAWALGIALPGSVDESGRPISPGLMPGWDGFPVAQRLREHFDVDILVDNDVNVMALGEARQHDPASRSSSSRPGPASAWRTSPAARSCVAPRAPRARSATPTYPATTTSCAAAANVGACRPWRAASGWPTG